MAVNHETGINHSPMPIALTVDVEGHWDLQPQEQQNFDTAGIRTSLEHLERYLARAEEHFCQDIPATWFIRCDPSIAAAMGAPENFLKHLDDFIERRRRKGDQFGLHVHFYGKDANGRWITETRVGRQAEQLDQAVDGWKRYFGAPPRISRMGECLMSNEIATALDHHGIMIDSTALAKRVRIEDGFHVDWGETPFLPYIPGKKDYRVPVADNAEASYRFVEAPFSMLYVNAPYDKVPIRRYCNLCFKPECVEPGLVALKQERHLDRLIAIVHPHEVMRYPNKQSLLADDGEAILQNLRNIATHIGPLKFFPLEGIAEVKGNGGKTIR